MFCFSGRIQVCRARAAAYFARNDEKSGNLHATRGKFRDWMRFVIYLRASLPVGLEEESLWSFWGAIFFLMFPSKLSLLFGAGFGMKIIVLNFIKALKSYVERTEIQSEPPHLTSAALLRHPQ